MLRHLQTSNFVQQTWFFVEVWRTLLEVMESGRLIKVDMWDKLTFHQPEFHSIHNSQTSTRTCERMSYPNWDRNKSRICWVPFGQVCLEMDARRSYAVKSKTWTFAIKCEMANHNGTKRQSECVSYPVITPTSRRTRRKKWALKTWYLGSCRSHQGTIQGHQSSMTWLGSEVATEHLIMIMMSTLKSLKVSVKNQAASPHTKLASSWLRNCDILSMLWAPMASIVCLRHSEMSR